MKDANCIMTSAPNRQAVVIALVTVVFSLFMGISFINRIGPLSLPDPEMHLFEIYSLSTGQAYTASEEWTDSNDNIFRVQYASVDSRIADADTNNADVYRLIGSPWVKDEHRNAQERTLSGEPGADKVVKRRSQYNTIIYAPQALVFSLLRAGGCTPWRALQGVRAGMLLLTVVLEVSAIMLVPKGGRVFGLISIMPVTIFLASSISSDALIPAISMLYVALVARFVKGAGGRLAVLVTVLLLVLLSLFKSAYVTMGLLFLFVPNRVLPLKLRLAAVALAAGIAVILFCSWKAATGGVNNVVTKVNIGQNVQWMCSHVFETIFCFCVSFVNLPLYFLGLPPFVYLPIIGAFALVAFEVKSSKEIPEGSVDFKGWCSKWRLPLVALVAALLTIIAILCSLALTWHDFSGGNWAASIWGIQERYFIPLLPMLVFALYPVAKSPVAKVKKL